MSQISLGAIISDVLKERNVENEASIKQCRRNFTKLIEKLGGNIDDLKNCQNSCSLPRKTRKTDKQNTKISFS